MFVWTLIRTLPVTVVLHAPLLYLVLRIHFADDGSAEQWWAIARVRQWSLLVLVVDIPMSAIAAHTVVHRLRGTRTPMMVTIAAGLRRTLLVAGVMLILYALVFALSLVSTPTLGAVAQLDKSGVIVWILVVGFSVPMLALYCRWFVAIPAVVLERTGVFGALSRSGLLTRDRRLRIAVIVVTVAVAFAALYVALIASTSTGWDSENASYWYTSALLKPWMATGATLLYITFNLLRAVLCATTYHFLELDAEEQSSSELSRVFD